MMFLLLLMHRPAAGESLARFFTREGGMNAVRHGGDTWTLDDLIGRRSLNPSRFDAHHARLGKALRLGVDGLEDRRSVHPRRFDFYHPVLAYLLDDVTGDTIDIGGANWPDRIDHRTETKLGDEVRSLFVPGNASRRPDDLIGTGSIPEISTIPRNDPPPDVPEQPTVVVPEPGSILLGAIGLVMLIGARAGRRLGVWARAADRGRTRRPGG